MTAQTGNNQSNYAIDVEEKLLCYWKEHLSGAPEHIDLHTDHTCPPGSDYCTAIYHFTIPGNCRNQLNKICEQQKPSLFIVLLSAFETLLYRSTNQTDLIVGFPTSHYYVNDNGYLAVSAINIVPLRTNLSGNPVFTDLLQQVQQVVTNANDHKNFHLELLKDSLKTNDCAISVPIYQVIFSYRNGEDGAHGNHLPYTSESSKTRPTGVEMVLSLENTTNELEGFLEYNSALFEADTIRNMMEHFLVLLNGVAANPNQHIAHIPLMSETERKKVLLDWNDTNTSFREDKCLHELFEEQVYLHPDAVAVALHGNISAPTPLSKGQLTYTELNKKANQLAHHLLTLGVGPDVLVGIYMKRSPEMAVAILGILKAGGAYVPIDPAYPKSRVDFMLKDSGITILLSQTKLLQQLPVNQTRVICLDTDWQKIAIQKEENPSCCATPENLVYVIYTSGSTGVPKGTLIIHKGVVNYLSWCIKAYRVMNGNGCPVNSSLGFDATVTSFLSPLLTGKKVLLLPEDGEIEALGTVLRSKEKFSLVKITPAHLEILSNLLPPAEMEGQANALIIGGEALTGKNLGVWRNHAPSTRLINEYGPTETVVGCCTYEIPGDLPLSQDIPIGRPIANTQIYILDSNLQPVPSGVTGEIYIGGAGLARGYLNRPELTAERFIPNPFCGTPNARLYKTGDLGYFLSDGNINFIGRSDHQVKIRGYRIELGEIESALGQYPGMQQSTVIVREDAPGDKRLVAYVVARKAQTIKPLELKRFLGEKLPVYMVPASLVVLGSLPLTTNGKIDRAALPEPDQQRTGPDETFVGARNNAEIKLVKLLEKALKMNHIGIQDNIFELGLDSLQAYRLFAQIKKMTGIQLPLSILFQAPTIELLADYLTRKEANAPWSSLVHIQPNGSKLPLFCIHAGAGTVLFYRELSRYLEEDQPFYGLQPIGLDGKDKFHTSIAEMAAHYIKEIQTINPDGPYLLGGYCFGGVVAFEMAQQLISKGCKVSLLAQFNAVSPTFSYNNLKPLITLTDKDKPVRSKPKALSDAAVSPKKNILLTTKEKVLFSLRKIKAGVKREMTWGKFKVDGYLLQTAKLIYECYIKMGIKCPEQVRKWYFYASNSEMVKAYQPKPFPGELIIFRSPGIYVDPHLGWSDFVTGKITTVDIPGHHKDRRQIMNEPFVQITAKELKKVIEKKTGEKELPGRHIIHILSMYVFPGFPYLESCIS